MKCEMKYVSVVFCILLFLSGCTDEKKPSHISNNPPLVELNPVTQETQKRYTARDNEFDRVVGWISETTLVTVERDLGEYRVYTYDVETAKKLLIKTVDEPIIDVKIHPSKKYLAIIMSGNSLNATILITSIDGSTMDKLTIQSSELYVDWHSTNVNLLLITAFNEDWTFDTFAYSSLTQEMNRIPSLHPILKWTDDVNLMAINWSPEDALSGGTISEISMRTSEISETDESGYIYFDFYENILVSVKIDKVNEQFIYTLTNVTTNEVQIYQTPALSNYSQWFVPEFFWTEDNSFLTYIASKSGLVDSFDGELHLAEFNFTEMIVKDSEVTYSKLMCTPSADRCLTGPRFESIIDLESGDIVQWLEINE
jgi:hypothetical protein